MNFVIIELLKFIKFDTIMTMTDSVFKKAYYILTHMIVIAKGSARLFLYYVWKICSLFCWVVLNRGLYCIIIFTKKLYCLLRVEIVLFMA